MEFLKDNYYHLYNRGVNKQNIFFRDSNYRFLIQKMNSTHKKFDINIIAYCLMPNHYHLFVQQKGDNSISKWIQIMFNSYVQAINKQENRKGHLFEGKLQSRNIQNETYLVHLSRYIHLNPLKAGIVKDLEDWPYSNYHEWIGIRNGRLFDPEFVKSYFENPNEYKKFLFENNFDDEFDKYKIDTE